MKTRNVILSLLLTSATALVALAPTTAASCAWNVGGVSEDTRCFYNIASECKYGNANGEYDLVLSRCRDATSSCRYNVRSDGWLDGHCQYDRAWGNCHNGGACWINVAAECSEGATRAVNVVATRSDPVIIILTRTITLENSPRLLARARRALASGSARAHEVVACGIVADTAASTSSQSCTRCGFRRVGTSRL